MVIVAPARNTEFKVVHHRDLNSAGKMMKKTIQIVQKSGDRREEDGVICLCLRITEQF